MHQINELAFKDETAAGLSITQFSTSFCGTCRIQEKELLKIQQRFPALKLLKIDAELSEELNIQLNIKSVPTLVISKDGKILNISNNFKKAEEVDALLQIA